MLNNIKLIGVIFLAFLLLTNCKKENKIDSPNKGEIVFSAIDVSDEKNDWDGICNPDLVPTHARVILNGVTYLPEVFILEDGQMFTQSLKLDEGNYTMTEFSIIDIDGNIIKATPEEDSEYAMFVDNPLDIEFYVAAFAKEEMAMEVLCFTPAEYENFGFEWFVVTPMTIREQCFFGDFCIKSPYQYYDSYYNDDGVVTIDEIAIFKLVMYHNDMDNVYKTFYNYDEVNGEYFDLPLCIKYADYDNEFDEYKLELWIYVTSGEGYDYVKFHTWEFTNDEMIDAGDDGVVDFVLGNCALTPPDLLLPPWMNLPLDIDYSYSSGGNDSYIDIILGGVGPGYDITNGTYDGWCADADNPLSGYDQMDAMSSLYPMLLPGTWKMKGEALAAANWLFNNKGDFTPYTSGQMQDALWKIFDGQATNSPKAAEMAAAALMHTDYSPLPGGWAAILFFDVDYDPLADENVQITFFVVDP